MQRSAAYVAVAAITATSVATLSAVRTPLQKASSLISRLALRRTRRPRDAALCGNSLCTVVSSAFGVHGNAVGGTAYAGYTSLI
ncbi:hypothetical protein [Streptomyces acidiscabies]|uniref:hypothetical protein n=1 Tax=Streptomyces acidiscabies TaxID=42234 RepID=UPI0009A0BBAF|nr:hypothetical protein [Streptomyces acidiscabies]